MIKQFWVMFLKDPSTGLIYGTASRHNAAGDYANNPHFIGYEEITVDIENLKQPRKKPMTNKEQLERVVI